jgi:very-short-patch-repair endonuclease
MIVEIDGDLYHTETPAAAHARLKFLTDEGVKLERINASACDTSLKAVEAVNRILATIEKLRRSR